MDKESVLAKNRGKKLARIIFENDAGISLALGGKPAQQVVWAWRNNNVPTKHRATLVEAARAKGWDVDEFNFRGDL